MRKKVLIIISVVFILLFIIYNVEFQFGNFKIGKQSDSIERNSKFDIENSNFSKDYLESNSITVLNLWASWCKPCLEEMPLFAKAKNKYPQIKFATLSIDRDEKELKEAIDKYHIDNDITLENSYYRKSIRNFLENRKLNSLFKSEVVPITYIIKNRKVVYKLTGTTDYEELTNKLNSLK